MTSRNFYPRPPRGGRRPSRRTPGRTRSISIHALREEGDTLRGLDLVRLIIFLSTPSARRATTAKAMRQEIKAFLSTPSARRATGPLHGCSVVWPISIHALREEGDLQRRGIARRRWEFLSTPSARRATTDWSRSGCGLDISIHALREEGDSRFNQVLSKIVHFYPRPPRGGRLRLF